MTGGMGAQRAAGPACSSSGHSRTSYFKKMKLTCSQNIWNQEGKKVPGEGQRRPRGRIATDATGVQVLPKTFLLSGGKKGRLGVVEDRDAG